jgi:hypothetical protein
VIPLFTGDVREEAAFMCTPRAEKSKNYDKAIDDLKAALQV